MPRSSQLSPEAMAVELVAADNAEPLDLVRIFGRVAPLEVDLGCGDGTVISTLALQNPERNFIGIEQLVGRTRSACKKIAHHRLTNARILRVDIGYAVEHLLPRGSVDVFHLLFPDPWPKRRHHVRRVVTAAWLRLVADALAPNGVIRMVTDDADYFAQMQRSLTEVPQLHAEQLSEPPPEFPVSTFEQHFRSIGAPIHRLTARNVSGAR